MTRSDGVRAGGDWKPLRAVGSTAYTDALPLAISLLALVLPVGLAWGTIGVPWSNESAGLLLAAFLLTLLIGAVSANESRGLLWARPRLYTNALEVRAGDEFRVRWDVAGPFRNAMSMRIIWEGEEVTFERRYNSTPESSTFAVHPVSPDVGTSAGTACIVVPADSMHSFSSANAGINWILHVRLETRRWPPVERWYAIKVLPGHTEATPA